MRGKPASLLSSCGLVAAAMSLTAFDDPEQPRAEADQAEAHPDPSPAERAPGGTTSRRRPARFFMNGDRNDPLLEAIRERTDNAIIFGHHFSQAFVPCGIGCWSYWLVDRRNGGVVAVPTSEVEYEMIWEIMANPDSDLMDVTFGPMDGVTESCSSQSFRWNGHAFIALAERVPVTCPEH